MLEELYIITFDFNVMALSLFLNTVWTQFINPTVHTW